MSNLFIYPRNEENTNIISRTTPRVTRISPMTYHANITRREIILRTQPVQSSNTIRLLNLLIQFTGNIYGLENGQTGTPIVPPDFWTPIPTFKGLTPDEIIRCTSIVVPTTQEELDELNKDGGCVVCCNEYTFKYHNCPTLRVIPCKHLFHVECIDNWLLREAKTCPTCRADVKKDVEEEEK